MMNSINPDPNYEVHYSLCRINIIGYYRSYRLVYASDGQVEVWNGMDLVETVASTAIAHKDIDDWQNAR